jgi:nicotinamide-nucleotide amidase
VFEVIAEVLTIGDELLRGEIVDSNKAFLSDRLLSLDVQTHWHASVRDDPADMTDAFRRAAERADVVLVSGGLGPTRDDLTSAVLAESFGKELLRDEEAFEGIRAFFRAVGREMTPNNATQADFPEGAEVLANPIGTAPGFMLPVAGTVFFCLPGVPREMMRMVDEQVLPRLGQRTGGGQVVRARLLRTFGTGESMLDDQLEDIAASDDVALGFRTAFPDNYLRPVARAATAEEAEAKLDRVCAQIRERLGVIIYGEGEETLPAVVGRLLREKGETLAVAESCTGGLIAESVTEVAGASECFRGGIVAYANEAKQALLGVPEAVLAQHGAVSEQTARAMAEGVRERFGSSYGLATTGISGPGGGSEEKPVGLVYLALAQAGGTHVEHFVFPLDRQRHRQLTSHAALDWVRRAVLGEELLGPTLMRARGAASAPSSPAQAKPIHGQAKPTPGNGE